MLDAAEAERAQSIGEEVGSRSGAPGLADSGGASGSSARLPEIEAVELILRRVERKGDPGSRRQSGDIAQRGLNRALIQILRDAEPGKKCRHAALEARFAQWL